jgi:hypothetical protein
VKAFIIFRDRAAYAQRCVISLLEAGLDPVVVDQGSSWPHALDWLDGMAQDGFTVLFRGGGHPRDLWEWEPFRAECGLTERYVVTDCDVVPSDRCPPDWPARLSGLLDAFPGYHKAGLGLRTDNLPAHYARREHVIEWEAQFRARSIADGVYDAIVDTTMALYRPLGERPGFSMSAVRTGFPYEADHLAWHEDLDHLGAELSYYHEHAEPGISYWTVPGRSAWGT